MSDKCNPKVSIITVCLNSARFLEETIRSVRSQTYPNIEYVVIDGGSTDGTVDIIRRCHGEIDYWISEPDKGISDAFNKGIKAASGNIIAFMNSQDYYADDEVIDKVVGIFCKQPDVDVVYGKTCYVPAHSKEIVGVMGERFARGMMLKRNIMPHQSLFMRKDVFDRFGLYSLDFRYAMDYEHLLRVTAEVIPFFIDEVLAVMRLDGISDTRKFAVCTELFRAQVTTGAPCIPSLLTLVYYYLTSAGLRVLRMFDIYTLDHLLKKLGFREYLG